MATDKVFLGENAPEPISEWRTPPDFIRLLEHKAGYKFDLDAAADATNATTPRFLTGPCNETPDCLCGLCSNWIGNMVWCNPPYGHTSTAAWADKAIVEHLRDPKVSILLLLPSNTSTRWFVNLSHHAHVKLLSPRLQFLSSSGEKAGNNRYDNALFVFGPVPMSWHPIETWEWKKELKSLAL
jgi:phage N-6-adenine-methyltransferase